MPRRKTRRRGGRSLPDPQALMARLQSIRDSGTQPPESELNQIHSDVQEVLPQMTDPQQRSRLFDLLEQIHDLPAAGGKRLKGGENALFHNWSADVNRHSSEIEAMLPTLSQLRSTAGIGSDVQAQLREQLDPHLEKLRELLDSAPTDDRRTRTVATRARTALARGEEGMRMIGAARKRRKTRRKRSRLN